jgi:predicted esterase
MSGDHPTLPENQRPLSGSAAGASYLALPPTAVDARPAGPTRLILAWAGFAPPRTASALAAAMPMTGVPTWRVYLELPGDPPAPEGAGSAALLDTSGMEAYGTAVERAVDDLPAALEEIRRDLDIEEGPVGLAGFSFGASAALLALARDTVTVSAAALVTPVVSPVRAAESLERRTGRERDWTDAANALAERLDLTAHASEIASRDTDVLLIAGARDRMVPAAEINQLRTLLREHGARAAEAVTFRMGHALASEPGTTAEPPTTEAVRVDGVINDWFRDRLAKVTEPQPTSRQDDPAESRPEPETPKVGGDTPGNALEVTAAALTPVRRQVRTPMGQPPMASLQQPRTPEPPLRPPPPPRPPHTPGTGPAQAADPHPLDPSPLEAATTGRTPHP